MTAMNTIKRSNDIFTVIDIGNTKVSALIGTSAKNNDVQIRVLGLRLLSAHHYFSRMYQLERIL